MTTTPKQDDPVEVVPAVTFTPTFGTDVDAVTVPGGYAVSQPAAVMPTQMRHPWKATVRTAVAFIVGVAPLAPEIYRQATQHDPAQATGTAAVALAIAGGVTRVLAMPSVEQLLRRFKVTRWLAAAAAPPNLS